LTQHYDLDFEIEEAEDTETVGGLIMSLLGHVAQAGDEATVQGVRFVVEAVDGLAVGTALVYLPEPEIETTSTSEGETSETSAERSEPGDDS
jgi:CBS domain containing-hemolysin-like protein